jgi:hypothetical protein
MRLENKRKRRLEKFVFIDLGADGSVRLFDLRCLEHSTILYEDPERRHLNRVAWNKQDASQLATIAQDSCEVNGYYTKKRNKKGSGSVGYRVAVSNFQNKFFLSRKK